MCPKKLQFFHFTTLQNEKDFRHGACTCLLRKKFPLTSKREQRLKFSNCASNSKTHKVELLFARAQIPHVTLKQEIRTDLLWRSTFISTWIRRSDSEANPLVARDRSSAMTTCSQTKTDPTTRLLLGLSFCSASEHRRRLYVLFPD